MMSNNDSRSGMNPYRRLQASSMKKIDVEGHSSLNNVAVKNDCMQSVAKLPLNNDQQQWQHQQQIYSNNNSMILTNSSVIRNSSYSSSDQSQACSLINWPAATSSNSNIDGKMESSAKKKKAPLSKMNLPFPWKLQKLLDDLEREGREDIASWSPSGRSFRVHKESEFSKDVMGHYFRQTKYNSFTRQLYIYGFSKIENGPEVGSFHHPSFLRDVKPEALAIGRNECNQDRRCKRRTKSFDASISGDGKRSLEERKSLLMDYYQNLYSSSNSSSGTAAPATMLLPNMASKNDSSSNVRALAPARMRTSLREGGLSSLSAPSRLQLSQRQPSTPMSSSLHLPEQRPGVQQYKNFGHHPSTINRASSIIHTSTNGSIIYGQAAEQEHDHQTNRYYNAADASASRLSLSSLPQDLLLNQGMASATALIQQEKQQTQSNIQDDSCKRGYDAMFDDDLAWLYRPPSSPRKEKAVNDSSMVLQTSGTDFNTGSNDLVGDGPREEGNDSDLNEILEPRTIEEMMSEQRLS